MADLVPFAVDVRFENARPGDREPINGEDSTVAMVVVVGEVDLATVPQLRRALSQVMAPPRQEVVLDLAGVEFMDASGVGALIGAAATAARAGVRFRLQATSPPVERILNLARLDGAVDFDV